MQMLDWICTRAKPVCERIKAKKSINQNESRRQEIKKNKYPWFDAECKKKRAEYRKAKGMHKSHANYYTKGERARAHKEYKKVLNRKSTRKSSTKG